MRDDLLVTEAWDMLATVYDPELGINLVDLGLVYKLAVMNGEVSVAMTLTAPGCQMSDTMPKAVERALLEIPGIATPTSASIAAPALNLARSTPSFPRIRCPTSGATSSRSTRTISKS